MNMMKSTFMFVTISAALVLTGCSNSYSQEISDEAKENSTITLNAPNDETWTSGLIVCPYTPLEQIPKEFRSEFSDEELQKEGSQWLGFVTADGVVVERISRDVIDFCQGDEKTAFSPGQTWKIKINDDGTPEASME